MSRSKFIAGTALAAVSLGTAGAVVANSSPESKLITPAAATTGQEIASSFGFRSGDNKNGAALRDLLFKGKETFSEMAISKADFSAAQIASVPSTGGRAWLAPAGNDVCLVISNPGGAPSSGCTTTAQTLRGDGVLIEGPGNGHPDSLIAVFALAPKLSLPTAKNGADLAQRAGKFGNIGVIEIKRGEASTLTLPSGTVIDTAPIFNAPTHVD